MRNWFMPGWFEQVNYLFGTDAFRSEQSPLERCQLRDVKLTIDPENYMLRVGMVDHHLNNWHADTFLKLLRGPLADEQVEVVAAWESDPIGDDWCAKNGVRRADSIEDAIGGTDAVLLLAPDNIDVHLKLAEAVLPAGKPTLIDKFLAPNVEE